MSRSTVRRPASRTFARRAVAGLIAVVLGLLASFVGVSPAYADGNVTGRLVDQFGDPVPGLDFDIVNNVSTVHEGTFTTDADGEFSVPLYTADFELVVLPFIADSNGNTYAYFTSPVFSIGSVDNDLGDVLLSRTSPTISGHITDSVNNDPLPNITVLVADGVGGFYQGLTDGSGNYSVVVPIDDVYPVAAGSDHYVWQDTDGDPSAPVDFTLDPGYAIKGVVTDAQGGGFLGGIDVFAYAPDDPTPPPTGPFGTPGYFDYLGPTDAANGAYSITVPAGFHYLVFAWDFEEFYDPQVYQGVNLSGSSCGCDVDDLLVPDDLATHPSVDFSLYGYEDWIHFSVQALRNPTPDAIDSFPVTVERQNGLLWDHVSTVSTDSGGFADLYAPGPGVYRITFPESAVTADDSVGGEPWTLDPSGDFVLFASLSPATGGCGCGSGPGAFTEGFVDAYFAPVASGGGGGGTPATPRPRRGSSPTVASFLDSVTPTPTPTPTSTPTPSSSPSSSPSPTPSATPEPVPGDPGFPWWIILIIVIAIGIVILVVVLVRRR